MLARLFALLLLAPALLPLASAAPDPTGPGVSKWVEAQLDLAQPTLTRIEVTGDVLVHKHTVGSRVYTATEMSRQYQGITTFDEGQGPVFVGNMESAVRAGLESILGGAFPTATRTITKVDGDEASLTAARGDPFDPPVRVHFAATIDRARADVGLGDLSDDAVAAVFDAGGRVASTLTLTADPGYQLTYVIRAPLSPAGVSFSQLSTGAVAADGSTVSVAVDNAGGASPLARSVTLHLLNANVEPPSAESLSSVVDVNLGALQQGSASLPLETNVTTSLRSVSVKERFPDALPASVTLDFVTAESLRELRAAGAVGDDDLAAADAAFVRAVHDDLAALGGEANTGGSMDRADLAKPSAEPVLFHAHATSAYPLPGDHAQDADLALAIGGAVRIDLDLTAGNGETTYRIHPPAGAAFYEPRGGTVTADGRTATFVVPSGTQADAGLSLRQAGVQQYQAEDAKLGVLVDLRDVDVTLGKAMGGDFGTVLADVTVRGDLAVIKVPDDVKASMGDALDLTFLSSDGVRLLLDRGVLTQAKLDELEASLLGEVRGNLQQALGADVEVTGGFAEATLDKALVSTPASGDAPIVFEAHASFARPLSGGGAAQAMTVYSVAQSFTFPRVRDLDTTYTVVLPRGLSVGALDAQGGETTQTEWSDGREAFTVHPTDDQAQTSVTMAVTGTFVLLKFWPVVLGVVVVLVLAIGTPIALVVLKRRKAQ